MTVLYCQIPKYEDYKHLEQQMREFKETSHKSEEGFYHKSIRLRVDRDLIVEFHGPLVLAGTQDEGRISRPPREPSRDSSMYPDHRKSTD